MSASARRRMRHACAVMAALVVLLAASGCTRTPVTYEPRLAASPPSKLGGTVPSQDSSRQAAALMRLAPRAEDPAGYGFDPIAALRHATAIAAFGPRPGGSPAERQAAEYIAARLRELGYEPRLQEFALPSGLTSVNVIAVALGRDESRRFLIGGHIDTKPPSPGANDNASGCGVVLETARILAKNPPPVSVEMVFWGTEEFIPEGTDSHHLGSRHHLKTLTGQQRDQLVGAVSVDMVGVGSSFHVRTMERGPQSLRDMMLRDARARGTNLTFLKDLGRTGWSDHEPYELHGVPAVWLQWQKDPNYHTVRDAAGMLRAAPVRTTGEFLVGFIYRLDEERIARLDADR
ncbi:MAG: M28 family peptidase [Coriobacteriia bacterium]|nr:M28 family peptidase [Coriobacteriia bacterium]